MVNNEIGENEGGKVRKMTYSWGGYFNTQYFAAPEEQTIGILFKQTQGITVVTKVLGNL